MKLRSGNGLAAASFLLFAFLLVFTGGTAPVRAESTDFDRLEPVPWAQRGIQMEDVDPLPALFSVGGWTQIEKSPVVLS
ncbi:MAG: hypothetical protein D6761_08650, partial [Candidatus Dadabacteria bacterium]